MNTQEDVPVQHHPWYALLLVGLILGIFAALVWVYFSQYDTFNRENVQAFIEGFGAWAPVIYAAVYIASAPIPFMTVVLSPLSGLLFGTLWGSLLVIGVATLSSLIPFTLARRLGRDWVTARLKGKRIEEIYNRSEGQGGFVFILLMRLIPLLPWEVQNYVAGLSKVAVPTFLLATVLGIIPASAALVFLGEAATDPTSWQFAVALGMNAIVMIAAPLIAMYVHRRRRKEPSDKL